MSTDLSTALAAGGDDAAAELSVPVSPQVAALDLSPREREMLAFERQWWRAAGAKETAIRDRFGLLPETEVEFVVDDGVVTLVKAESTRPDRADRRRRSQPGRHDLRN